MAELMQFNGNSNEPPKFRSPFMNQRKNPDVANLKKRKLFVGVTEDPGLPERKHICCEAIVGSECDLLQGESISVEDSYTSIEDGLDVGDPRHAQVNSAQGSSSFPGDAHSASTEVNFDSSSGTANSYDEASTSWANSGSGISRSTKFYVESSMRDGKDIGEDEQCRQQDTSWHDIDCLEECISPPYSKDSSEQTGLEKFLSSSEEVLSSSGVDPNFFPFSAERQDVEQEIQPEKCKPTIDQEFEEYFSTLML